MGMCLICNKTTPRHWIGLCANCLSEKPVAPPPPPPSSRRFEVDLFAPIDEEALRETGRQIGRLIADALIRREQAFLSALKKQR